MTDAKTQTTDEEKIHDALRRSKPGPMPKPETTKRAKLLNEIKRLTRMRPEAEPMPGKEFLKWLTKP